MKATIYTTHCPNCTMLESKLKLKGIHFDTIDDKDIIVSIGRANNILSAPILEVDGTFYKLQDALKWVNMQ